MDDFIKNVESLEKTGLLIDGANETVKNQVKKRRWISWGYDGTIDSIKRWIFSIISIHFNDESSGKRSPQSKKMI